LGELEKGKENAETVYKFAEVREQLALDIGDWTLDMRRELSVFVHYACTELVYLFAFSSLSTLAKLFSSNSAAGQLVLVGSSLGGREITTEFTLFQKQSSF